MSKRKVIVDGEVKLVSYKEWLNSSKTTPKSPKKKIHIETDPINEDKKQDLKDNPTEE